MNLEKTAKIYMDLSKYNERNWTNVIIQSEIGEACCSQPCVMGIDEAGRGPVLGPMVYGACFCPISRETELKTSGVADSKTLTEAQREKLFDIIHENCDYVGWSMEILSPMGISNNMYKRPKVSLNEISHNAAIGLIHRAIDAGVNLKEVYLDTVGPPEKYQAKLESIFPTLRITVSKKADSLFPCVSAASICAKVARDRVLKDWRFPEGSIASNTWGSGYPGDQVTKTFLLNTLDPIFGFPGIVRFSWSTATKIMDEKCVNVTWEESDDEDESKEKTPSVLQFFAKSPPTVNSSNDSLVKNAHAAFFFDRCLSHVSNF